MASIAEPTQGKNHDAAVVRDDCVVVVDGATPLESIGTADAASVRALSHAVAAAIADCDSLDPVTRFLEAATKVQTDDGASAVAAAVWRDGDQLIGAAVGDCVVAVQTVDGTVRALFDHVLGALDATAVEKMYERDGGPHRDDASDLLATNRRLLNTAEGYGAFGPPGLQPHHVQRASWPARDVVAVLVCSDGFWRALDTYALFDDERELLQHATNGLAEVVAAIRRVEAADHDGRLHPRISTADDVTAVLLTQPTPPPLHLAQYNIARLNHPVGHPATQGFVDLIDETNARAQASPGFVWRHGIDTRDTDDAPYDDKFITVNASIWETVEHLRDFAYKGFHRDVFRRRKEWMNDSAAVMWWTPAGTTPTLQACMARLAFHDRYGSSPYAFQTGQQYPVMAIEAEGDNSLRMWLDGRIVGHASLDGHCEIDDSTPLLREALLDAVEVVLRDRGLIPPITQRTTAPT